MKRFLLALPVAAVLVGCGAQTPANPSARGLAASFLAGRAFDRAQTALKSGDTDALRDAGQSYARATSKIQDKGLLLRGVLPLSQAGDRLDRLAKFAPRSQREALLERALTKYRAASAFLPANPQPGEVDAQTLNQVGYPLADRGTTPADWERARQLTRLSLAEWDKQMKPLAPDSAEYAQLEANRTLGALDSYAWALFKLGRIDEALQKQERVIAFAREHPEVINSGQYGPDIPYHMAEIYRAAGRGADAEEQYRTALDLRPDPELFEKIEIALTTASA